MMRAMAMVGAPAEAPPAPLAIEPSKVERSATVHAVFAIH